MRLPLFLAVLLIAAPVAAQQIYRWIDEKGTTHYSQDPPPAGVKAVPVPIRAEEGPPAPDTQDCYTVRCQGERLEQRIARRDELDARLAAERAAAAPKTVHGLTFSKYISIQRGMSEGELLGLAGEPDLKDTGGAAITAPTTVQGGRNLRVPARAVYSLNTYTYLPTSADPFTTTISLVGGRVSEIERIRKF
jgi:Domain of unknown function (DUF4124)